MKVSPPVRNNSRRIITPLHWVFDPHQRKIILRKAMFENIAALFFFFAAILFILAILLVRNGLDVEEVLAWEEPMPWAILLMVTGMWFFRNSKRQPALNN